MHIYKKKDNKGVYYNNNETGYFAILSLQKQ